MSTLRPLRSFETDMVAAVRDVLDRHAPGAAKVTITWQEHPDARVLKVVPERSSAAHVTIHIGMEDEVHLRIGATTCTLWQNRRHPDLALEVGTIFEAVCAGRMVEYGTHSTQLELELLDGRRLRLGALLPPFARRFVSHRRYSAYS